jgi:hypothetical protein
MACVLVVRRAMLSNVRRVMKNSLALALALISSTVPLTTRSVAAGLETPMIRPALVGRHNPVLHEFDARNPLSVGNGNFAFTMDVTGLQTFADAFTNTTPLGTLSQWGWHSFPNPEHWTNEKFHYREYDVFGRKVGYNDVPGNRRTPEINWLRGNPHRLHLGQIGFLLIKSDLTLAQTNDLTDIKQTLDLWTGLVESWFKLEDKPVYVQTVCHPQRDFVAVRVYSPLLREGRLKIQIHFPYGTGSTVTADWTKPDAHETVLRRSTDHNAEFERRLDGDTYVASASWSEGGKLVEIAKHRYVLTPASVTNHADFCIGFAPIRVQLEDFVQTRAAAADWWSRFWSKGGAIDLSGSKDPRWHELERRIVLSQYLTAIQCSGVYPPQETGLTYNSWEGKFHLEMHWWHAAHFALWNRLPLLDRSLDYYDAILPQAQALAKRQGYSGARWPKMTDPSGIDSPSPVGPFLIWQQPHPIFYAELCYRANGGDGVTLRRYKNVVMESAEFMATYAEWDTNRSRYVLGPVLQCAQEIFPKDKTLNPTFELTYWRWGLETAQHWRRRLGLAREPKWDRVLNGLSKLPLEQNKYLFAETATGTYTEKKWTDDHPSVTAALGMLPGPAHGALDPG